MLIQRICLSLFLFFPTLMAQAQDEWQYSEVVRPDVPVVGLQDWAQSELDRFVLARLESKQLVPAAQADKSTLVRRLYLDLLGVPPSLKEQETFLSDESPEAHANLVNRLLEDPRYGEHWARSWLDLARYADTAGYEGDPDLPYAWRYRDYVIDSLNRDKPYNRFILEQLAGDELVDITGAGELPNPPAENLVALTFLRLAPFTEPRGDESRHEMLSEMTTTVSSVFLGLTVGCAKCHDHKYDPIPTKDFYRMKAFFATIAIPPPRRGDAFQIGGPTPADFYREGEKDWVQQKRNTLQQEASEAGERAEQMLVEFRKRLGISPGFGIQALGGGFGNDYFFDQNYVTDNRTHITAITASEKTWTFYTDGKVSTQQGSLAGENAGHWYSGLENPEYVSLGAATNGSGEFQAAAFNGRLAHVMVFDRVLSAEEIQLDWQRITELDGLQFWLDAADLDADPETENPQTGENVELWKDKVAGIELSGIGGDRIPQLGTLPESTVPAVVFDGDFLRGSADGLPFLKDKQGTVITVFSSQDDDESYIFEVGGQKQFVTTFVNPVASGKNTLAKIIRDAESDLITSSEREEYLDVVNKSQYVNQHLRRLEPWAMTLRHSLGPPYEPGVPTSRVMVRGEWDNPGEVVEPGFLSVITGHHQPAAIRLDTFKRWPTRSRRKALADWIASKENPLTARVMVNRLWYSHFGRGIVETTSDFGNLSGGPSHPELLDYLAREFMDHGWSLKHIHRLICNSSTYQQQSHVENNGAMKVDPENRLLWSFPIRRLGAEVVRDRILSVSGRLNSESFGLPIFPPLPDGIEDRVKYDQSKWATQYGEEGRRRSIYIYQQRTLNMPLLQTFDAPVCDESRPRRRASTTALQALAMYNGPLVTMEVEHFADRVIFNAADDPHAQIAHAVRLALCRKATDMELQDLAEYYRTFDDPREAMISICRVLYNTSEFLYLD
ncbi:MAG: DUF1553 domain-containing protein [Planctomycetota bacterium]|nr:DUF1553 domain-containing protein [Planctomycetota bacterium]